MIFLIRLSFALLIPCAMALEMNDVEPLAALNSTNQFKIMTFNVRYGTAKDGNDKWKLRRDALTATIDSYEPDILCLQEALPAQVRYIVRHTKRKYKPFGRGRNKLGGGESTRILVDTSVFAVSGDKTYWLSESKKRGSKSYGSSHPRIATRMDLTHKASGKSLVLTNTHLDNELEEARQKGAQQIINTLNETSANAERLIITGDFNNVDNNEPAVKVVEGAGFSDTHYELTGTEPGTFHQFTGNPSILVDAKIDHIYRKGKLKPIASLIVKATYNQGKDRRYPSDHFPIVSILELTDQTVPPLRTANRP